MLSRDEALALLQQYIQEESLLKHSLATEGVLRELARFFQEDEELWGITGLLHDLDYESTKDNPQKHGLKSAEILKDKLPAESIQAIKAHNGEMTGVEPTSKLDFALRCGETVTGLIMAAAYVRPNKLEGMKPKSLRKKMKDKSFAASVNRETIGECSKLNLELSEFLSLAIAGMQKISRDLGF